jgi:hypothetical protein
MATLMPDHVEFEQPADYRAELVARPDRIRLLMIPARRYLTIDGSGAPAAAGFRDAIGSLYPIAYTLHVALKRRGVQAPVGALEGLFWKGAPGPMSLEQYAAIAASNEPWSWRLLLPVPSEGTDEDVAAAISDVAAKRRPPLLDRVRCEPWAEGPVAQILHVGPYDAEPPTIERLQRSIAEQGLRPRGCHHEIYISDPGRTNPARLKTLIRQPVDAGQG